MLFGEVMTRLKVGLVCEAVLVFCLSFIGISVLAEIEITLQSDGSVSEDLIGYTDPVLFERRFANVPPDFSGRIHQPAPSNACSYIEPLGPDFITQNFTWCALVDSYPSCPEDMVRNVRNAGYNLIITSSIGNKERKVSNDLVNTLFPVVVVSEHYGDYLKLNALSNSTRDPVIAHVEAVVIVSTFIVTFSFVLFLGGCCCFCVVCCVRCCRRTSSNTTETQIPNIEERRRNMERLHRQERLARQELIESILRQLQDLQVDLHMQVPLGEQEAKNLPMKPYSPAEKNKCETCAICVDDFAEGEMLRILPCDHFFHTQCIDEWLINHSSLCPLCKMEVPRQNNRDRAGPIAVPQAAEPDFTEDTGFPSSDNAQLIRENRRTAMQSTYGTV